MIASSTRWALMHELDGPEPELDALLGRMAPVDLVLVEGFKASPHPKIEVHRPSLGHAPFWPARRDVVAVASDAALPDCPIRRLDLDSAEQVAAWSLDFLKTHPV